MCHAPHTKSVSSVGRIAQPTTRREYRSSRTARYSHPSPVEIAVMSAVQTRFGAAAVKHLIEHIRGGRSRRVRLRRHAESARRPAAQLLRAHQADDAVAAQPLAVGLQRAMDPRTAVAAATRGMNGADAGAQAAIGPDLWRHQRPPTPGVIPTGD